MKAADIRKKSPADIDKLIQEQEAELREFRFGMTGAHSKNVKKARALRKVVARAKTIRNETKS